MKKSILLTFFFALFMFSACVSKPLPIPGDTGRTIRNIYVEYMNIANTYMKLEDYKSASDYYKLAMQNHKIYWACYYKLALCYVYSSDWTNAEPMYKNMLKRDPENASLQASLAYIYSMNGNVKRALKIYKKLLQEQPDNESYLENYLVLILSDKKIFKRNRIEFEEALDRMNETYPENAKLTKITEKYKEYTEVKNPEEDTEVDDEEEDDELTDPDFLDENEPGDEPRLEPGLEPGLEQELESPVEA